MVQAFFQYYFYKGDESGEDRDLWGFYYYWVFGQRTYEYGEGSTCIRRVWDVFLGFVFFQFFEKGVVIVCRGKKI